MTLHENTFQYRAFDDPSALDSNDRLLLELARQALEGSYAPYSGYHVGAAILLANGEIVTGSNQENASFPAGSCAERVALYHAMHTYPGVAIEAVAITAHSGRFGVDNPVTPCGICRQALVEQELRFSRNIRLILAGSSGRVYVIGSVAETLPLSFYEPGLMEKT